MQQGLWNKLAVLRLYMHCKPRFFFNKELVLFVFFNLLFLGGGSFLSFSLYLVIYFFSFFFLNRSTKTYDANLFGRSILTVLPAIQNIIMKYEYLSKRPFILTHLCMLLFLPLKSIWNWIGIVCHKNIWFIFHENTIPESNPIFFLKICKVKATFPCTLKLK